MEQLTVPIRWGKNYDLPKDVRRSRLWGKAITALLKDERLKKAKAFEPLPLPREVEHAWYIESHGILFRCVVGYVMFPLDGGPPGYRGRVDVAFTQ